MTEPDNHYGPTAARAHGRPGRETRPATPTIDMHTHVMVPAAQPLLAAHLDPATIPLAHFTTPDTKALNRKQEADRRPDMLDMDVRIATMDAAGIDHQVIMPPPGQVNYAIPRQVGIDLAEIINDGIAEFAGRLPARFTGLGTVPMQDGEAAARALERALQRGLRGVQS